jgi:protein SCO1/2
MFSRLLLFIIVFFYFTGFVYPVLAVESGGVSSSQELENGVSNSFEVGDPELDVLWIDEKNGEYIPLETVFNDEEGNSVSLDSIIDKPTIILPVYFYCPSSCSLNLVNLATAVKRSNLNPGKDFNIIAYSFNENEDSENARIAKRNYMRLLPKDFPHENWKFLTGNKSSIDAVTQAIGYQYKPLGDGTYIHPSALVVVAEDGMIIKYVYGSFVTGDVDIAISEAQKGTPGISVKRFLAYCFNYDPTKSRSFFQNMKIGALIVFGVLGVLFFMYVRKSDRTKKGSFKER